MKQAVSALKHGGVIAYPTEAVFGLGCDPFNYDAVKRVLTIKQRAISKGLILIAANWEHVERLIEPISTEQRHRVEQSWPGPVTWLFQANALVPSWIRGDSSKVALRVTSHPIAHELCAQFDGPIVSTSANPASLAPAISAAQVLSYFPNEIDIVVDGEVGEQKNPSEIRDVITNRIVRAG